MDSLASFLSSAPRRRSRDEITASEFDTLDDLITARCARLGHRANANCPICIAHFAAITGETYEEMKNMLAEALAEHEEVAVTTEAALPTKEVAESTKQAAAQTKEAVAEHEEVVAMTTEAAVPTKEVAETTKEAAPPTTEAVAEHKGGGSSSSGNTTAPA
jgi:hypothetical protein